MIDACSLTKRVTKNILDSGIELVGVTSAEPFLVEKRTVDPCEIMSDAKAIIVTGFCFHYQLKVLPSNHGNPRGVFTHGSRVFTPARKYHNKIVKYALKEEGYGIKPSMKIPAKLAAVRAGLGKYGKNCVVYTPRYGSWVMFECFITNAPLVYDDHETRQTACDGCDVCIKRCPTNALLNDYRLDRSLCITNWLWGKYIPIHLREKQENRLFGCGECLNACPKNSEISFPKEFPYRLEDYIDSPDLLLLLKANDEEFRKFVPSFPRWAGADNIKANAIIALGNVRDTSAVPTLDEMMVHKKPKIRAYVAWALSRMGDSKTRQTLIKALKREKNKKVKNEIEYALSYTTS